MINEIDPRSGRYGYSYKDFYYQKDKYGGESKDTKKKDKKIESTKEKAGV